MSADSKNRVNIVTGSSVVWSAFTVLTVMDEYGWRGVFYIVGVPGLIIAPASTTSSPPGHRIGISTPATRNRRNLNARERVYTAI